MIGLPADLATAAGCPHVAGEDRPEHEFRAGADFRLRRLRRAPSGVEWSSMNHQGDVGRRRIRRSPTERRCASMTPTGLGAPFCVSGRIMPTRPARSPASRRPCRGRPGRRRRRNRRRAADANCSPPGSGQIAAHGARIAARKRQAPIRTPTRPRPARAVRASDVPMRPLMRFTIDLPSSPRRGTERREALRLHTTRAVSGDVAAGRGTHARTTRLGSRLLSTEIVAFSPAIGYGTARRARSRAARRRRQDEARTMHKASPRTRGGRRGERRFLVHGAPSPRRRWPGPLRRRDADRQSRRRDAAGARRSWPPPM